MPQLLMADIAGEKAEKLAEIMRAMSIKINNFGNKKVNIELSEQRYLELKTKYKRI